MGCISRLEVVVASTIALIIVFVFPPFNLPQTSIIGAYFFGSPLYFIVTHGIPGNMQLIKFLPLTLFFDILLVSIFNLGLIKIIFRD